MSLLKGFLVHESSQLVLCRLLDAFTENKRTNKRTNWLAG